MVVSDRAVVRRLRRRSVGRITRMRSDRVAPDAGGQLRDCGRQRNTRCCLGGRRRHSWLRRGRWRRGSRLRRRGRVGRLGAPIARTARAESKNCQRHRHQDDATHPLQPPPHLYRMSDDPGTCPPILLQLGMRHLSAIWRDEAAQAVGRTMPSGRSSTTAGAGQRGRWQPSASTEPLIACTCA
jgi:hypothetical protein